MECANCKVEIILTPNSNGKEIYYHDAGKHGEGTGTGTGTGRNVCCTDSSSHRYEQTSHPRFFSFSFGFISTFSSMCVYNWKTDANPLCGFLIYTCMDSEHLKHLPFLHSINKWKG